MELLNKYPSADLRVYAVWFNMYPGDHRSNWRADLLSDPRVTNFWDEGKLVGRWVVEQKIVDHPRSILWDAYLLFGPEAKWEDLPEPLIGWGKPVYHRRHKLRKEILPMIEPAPVAEQARVEVDSEEPQLGAPMPSGAPTHFDLMVIGAGGAGFAAAIRGAELGKQVALVEAGTLGGVCVNVGCVPSKTLLRAAEINHLGTRNPFEPGLRVAVEADWTALIAHKDKVVSEMRQSRYEDVLAAYPEISLLRGWAKLLGENQVEITPVDDSNGAGPRLYAPDKIIIATGSSSWAPPIEGLEEAGYLDSTAAFELRERPESMIIVGASSVGLEVGQLFSRFGTKVTMLEIQDDILPEEDSEISGQLIDYLREEGIVAETNVFITEVSRNENGYRVIGRQLGEDRVYEAAALLMATGRRANTAEMGLEQAGVELGTQGEILVDEHLQTSNSYVYAAGDVLGRDMFVYTAAYGGKLAVDNALDGAGRFYGTVALPRVTFTDPAVASVGLTEAQAYDQGHEVKVTAIPLELISRPQANGDTRGLIKLVADKTTDQLLGAHVLAAEAGEVIQTATLAIKVGMSVEDLRGTLFPYLTMVEGLKLAAISFDKDPAMLSCCAG
ncbi:MAG: mercury(II) reductase [Chloroflexi bacterium]|nr:mercury(II) reductase [Chloroflexota bacterium]